MYRIDEALRQSVIEYVTAKKPQRTPENSLILESNPELADDDLHWCTIL